jgi:hypothetical protein
MKTYVLYGVAARNRNELVCMFFDRKKDIRRFKLSLPGDYRVMTIKKGLDYQALKIGSIK